MMMRFLVSCVLSTSMLGSVHAEDKQPSKQPSTFLLDWEQVPELFRSAYAPLEWKKLHLGLDIDALAEQMREQLFADGRPSVQTYQKTLKKFLASFRDYHVFPIFCSSEHATLPFSVMSAEGRYWIAWINREHLPNSVYQFEVGDEIVLFDGKPVQEAIDEIIIDSFASHLSRTNQLLAEHKLTARAAIQGDAVPSGFISIHVKSFKTGKISEYQMMWEAEDNELPPVPLVKGNHPALELEEKIRLPFLDTLMMVHFPKIRSARFAGQDLPDPLAIGTRESCFPPLAQPEEYISGEGQTFPFYAYTFTHPATKKTIGFVRIASYRGGEEEAHAFGELIEYFEANTDALVIDQLNNPGGRGYYLAALASFLSPEPLDTPKHQFKLTYKNVLNSFKAYNILKGVKTDEMAKELYEELADETPYGYPVTYQSAMMLRQLCKTCVDTWKNGKTITPPMHMGGIDRIYPHPDFTPYSKPILFLINGLDFSGGDFLPAILKDSTYQGKPRIVLFGERTAGAGGAVEIHEYPNRYGVYGIGHTVSIAYRTGFAPQTTPLENLGVTPDIPYTITQNDIRNQWADYRQAVLDAVAEMTGSDALNEEELHREEGECDDEEYDEEEREEEERKEEKELEEELEEKKAEDDGIEDEQEGTEEEVG